MGEVDADTAWDLTGLRPPATGLSARDLERAAFDMTEPGYHPTQVDEMVERAIATVKYLEAEVIPTLVEQITRRDEHITRLMTELSATRVTGQVLVDQRGAPISISEAERVELEYLRRLHHRAAGDATGSAGDGRAEALPRTPLPAVRR